MKQNKQMYVAPKVELIAMELQGVLCASGPYEFTGAVMNFENNEGAWVMP